MKNIVPRTTTPLWTVAYREGHDHGGVFPSTLVTCDKCLQSYEAFFDDERAIERAVSRLRATCAHAEGNCNECPLGRIGGKILQSKEKAS